MRTIAPSQIRDELVIAAIDHLCVGVPELLGNPVPVTNLIRAPEAGAPDHYGVNVWAEPARPGGRGATVALMR